jgi:hypothetical protein
MSSSKAQSGGKGAKAEPVGPRWFVFWRELVKGAPAGWSKLHRVGVEGLTLCNIEMRQEGHVGVRAMKRAPKVHFLKVCVKCRNRAAKADGQIAPGSKVEREPAA